MRRAFSAGKWLLPVFILVLAGLIVWLSGGYGLLERWWRGPLSVSGIVWQVDNPTADISGNWQKLGVDHLLIQWSEVDGASFVGGPGAAGAKQPDWLQISRQPWAKHVILGLAGHFGEKQARQNAVSLARDSAALFQTRLPLNIEGYYFPVEVDPTWKEAPETMKAALALLPRPLWISVYDSANIGAKPLADWLASWLPPDVGVFFQDGVGVEARSPAVAREYADALAARLGRKRVKVIVEAFRPKAGGGFRPATVNELLPQIAAMQGYDIYLFDGPHYLDEHRVDELAAEMKSARHDLR
ncbi:hypothetical protein [Phyllobacterium leguminum]|uniref:Spherulation-specific family 4 protein n=1 Tax=Phyllobacterium leguminum TaxID=314237 RepID=A0A318T4V7_9HYPH|nr:hypothetical protein [Phyllobacterium leguminum]PYE90000.1 hypothetical protein C7477_10287 [Phyllobacterium leguminum]